jgi:hypothetical protein
MCTYCNIHIYVLEIEQDGEEDSAEEFFVLRYKVNNGELIQL